jgi:hypothetical protein
MVFPYFLVLRVANVDHLENPRRVEEHRNGDYPGNLRMPIVFAPLQNMELLGRLK